MNKRIQSAPFDIDPDAIAAGVLEMFDDSERRALQFGLLPAKKMEVIRKCLTDKFSDNRTGMGDKLLAINREGVHEFSLSRVVAECEREITLALYAIGNLVV